MYIYNTIQCIQLIPHFFLFLSSNLGQIVCTVLRALFSSCSLVSNHFFPKSLFVLTSVYKIYSSYVPEIIQTIYYTIYAMYKYKSIY